MALPSDPNKIYKDFAFTFLPHPVTKDLVKLTKADAVKRSIKNLVFTNFYERPFQPEIGSSIRHTLFEPITTITESVIRNNIYNCIINHEPRVDTLEVYVKAFPNEMQYKVDILFRIVSEVEDVRIEFFLAKAR